MPDFITINGQKIGLGAVKKVNLNIAKLPTHTNIDLLVHVYRAKEDGPVLLLTGGLHGDEINGIEIIRRLIASKKILPKKGTVIAIPIVNVYGFILNERGVPDGKDINRSFPGVKGGSLARLLAYTLLNDIIPEIDCGIDFHTGGASRANFPQIRCSLNLNDAKELAQAFAPPVILHSILISHSFRSAAHKKGKPILVYETGESSRFDEFGISEGINGTLRLMKHLNMIDEAPAESGIKTFRKSIWVRARNAGLFLPILKLGETVTKNQIIATINDPYGAKNTKMISPVNGRIIGQNNKPLVHKGDALIHIAYNS